MKSATAPMSVLSAALVVAALSPTARARWTSSTPAASTTPFFVPPSKTCPRGIRRKLQQRLRTREFAETWLFALDGSVPNGDNMRKGTERGRQLRRKGAKSEKGRKNATKRIRRSDDTAGIERNADPEDRKSQRKRPQKTTSSSSTAKKGAGLAKNEDSSLKSMPDRDDETYIQFSRAFQRHIVYRRGNNEDLDGRERVAAAIIQSFEFLDEAVALHPNARALAPSDLPFPPPSCSLVYSDERDDRDEGGRLAVSRGRPIDSDVEEEECETTVAGMGLWTLCELEYPDIGVDEGEESKQERAHDALRTLLRLVSSDSSSFVVPRHFFRLDVRRFAMRGLASDSIEANHARVADLLSRGRRDDGRPGSFGLAMDPSDVRFVLQNFPQLCLYDCAELEGLVRFLLQPLPPTGSIPSVALVADRGEGGAGVDWPSLCGQGHGAGLTVDQATRAIRMMPELLALYYEDARKPSTMYLYNQMRSPVPPKLIDEANAQLNLEGADPSDAYTFGHLRSLGVSWGQVRILQASLPLWTTCGLEPGWELLQRGPVRSMLKRPALDYLRQRLQAGPSDVYRLLKTHTRLSTYDACGSVMPKLDDLQGRLRLSSAEVKKLAMRMPSLMGMGRSALSDRVEFFTNEADMSISDLREAALKQPSLLQYSVTSTLRPKLDFFAYELGISDPSYICRIIKSAPAAMGLSLATNLRPKVASMMHLCALGPYEVGYMVSTSPQILLLSQKSKIEPTLKFLANTLVLDPQELGELISSTPRILNQGVETSLARKMDMLTKKCNGQNSKEMAVAIVRKNPALLVASNAVLANRIERCPEDVDIATWLLPSNKGRGRNRIGQIATEIIGGDPILASSDDASSFASLTRIYPSPDVAARELGITETAVREACAKKTRVGENLLSLLADYPPSVPGSSKAEAPGRTKIIPVSVFCSGGIYPGDSVGVARGQSRTGGLAIQLFTDSSHDRARFLREFSAAAESCFGIRVPVGRDDDGSKSIAVFPLVNPSRNRCELFACSGALKILEALLLSKRNDKETSYDVKIYTDANSYTWKLVESRERLLEMGSHFTSQDLVAASGSVNIDILHPLARSFSRLNGCVEPPESPHPSLDNARVEFVHSMDGVSPSKGGLGYARSLKRQATSAAMWQFNRERNLV